MTTDATFRLEEALCLFEDIGFVQTAFDRFQRTHPAFTFKRPETSPAQRAAGALRSLMLGAVRGSPAHREAYDILMQDRYARALHHWCRDSRRIFSLDRDLQLLLNATDIDRAPLWDIRFPFETFAIVLAQPIVSPNGSSYDLIMLMREPRGEEGQMLTVQVYSTDLAGYRSIPRLDRDHLTRLIGRPREGRRVAALLGEFSQHVGNRTDVSSISIALAEEEDGAEVMNTDGSVGATAAYMRNRFPVLGEAGAALSDALRLGIGLCLYLDLCVTGAGREDLLTRVPLRRDSQRVRLVTDGAEVCLVQTLHVLSPEEREAYAASGSFGSEPSPHYRRGYWSRPPGKGDDPTAAKTVWHRPTIVRRDSVPEGALPLGSQSATRLPAT